VNERGERLLLLVRRDVRRNEVDPMQLASLHCSSRQRKMPLVYGIEGPAKQSDIHVFFAVTSV